MSAESIDAGLAALPLSGLLVQCRPGFESDCAAELTERLAAEGLWGYCRTQGENGFVEYLSDDRAGLARVLMELPLRSLVFARQWAGVFQRLEALPPGDRASPIAEAVAARLVGVSGVFIEYPDTNAGKRLSGFARKFTAPLHAALGRAGVALQPETSAPRLHLFLTDSSTFWLAVAPPDNSAPWPMGILRLKMPRTAPSRSTLKLEEALRRLLTDAERRSLLRPGARALDLGAAPGGWSWQLVQRGLRVTAVDNGPMASSLIASGAVEHRRCDAFTYRPTRPVQLMVCDIVDKPARVAELMARWLEQGWCRAAIFNLKLPMRKRYAAVAQALSRVTAAAERGTGRPPALACKQLYHDREEVTALVVLQ